MYSNSLVNTHPTLCLQYHATLNKILTLVICKVLKDVNKDYIDYECGRSSVVVCGGMLGEMGCDNEVVVD